VIHGRRLDSRGGRCGRTITALAMTAAVLRYPSDVTDEEWALMVPFIPPAKHGGNKLRG